MTKEMTVIDDRTIAEVEDAVESCSLATLQGMSPIRRTAQLARGMAVIRKAMAGPLLNDVKELADSPLGYLTDRPPGAKDKQGKPLTYRDETIRDAIIEGMLRGASVVGNEINVIAGRCYLTKQYFERQLREFPGLSDLRIIEGVPTNSTNGALVPMRASWRLNGETDELLCDKTVDGDYRIPVRVNSQMGVDAILGKAKRKLMAKILARITGSAWAAEQAEVDTEVDASPEPEPQLEEQPGPLGAIEPMLTDCETLGQVKELEQRVLETLCSDEDRVQLAEWCDWRREQIRANRGERSNSRE